MQVRIEAMLSGVVVGQGQDEIGHHKKTDCWTQRKKKPFASILTDHGAANCRKGEPNEKEKQKQCVFDGIRTNLRIV